MFERTASRHTPRTSRRPAARLLSGASWALLGLLGACSGSSDSGGGSGGSGGSGLAGQGGFQLTQISVEPGRPDWPINKAIEFVFNDDVDGDTVDRNTIQIREVGGGDVLGDFLLKPGDPRRVIFQPNCPTQPDFSDAGLKPGRSYEIRVIGADSGQGITVLSTSARPLVTGQLRLFGTPDEDQIDKIFDDLKPDQGPRPVVRGVGGVPLDQAVATRVEINGGDLNAEDGGVTRYFELSAGAITEIDVPLNLFSKPESRVEVFLVVDQPVDASAANISSDRVELQFQDTQGAWRPIRTVVTLENNCAEEGATLRLDPVGILPPSSDLRVNISSEFRDIRGEFNLLPINSFARMSTELIDANAFPDPNVSSDELLEHFDDDFFEDETTAFAESRALWGDGRLVATFGFGETQTDQDLIQVFSDFDYTVSSGVTIQFNTETQSISSADGTKSQIVEDGRLYCRNLTVEEGARLVLSGPNPLKVFATGEVEIGGTLEANGFPANNVQALNLATQPQPGGIGAASGGNGGIGSPLTTSSTPRGGPGRGAFNTAGLGGRGGESGYSGTANRNTWRPGGGGGGVFGPNDPPGATPSPTSPENGFVAAPGFDGFDSLTLLLTQGCETDPPPGGFDCEALGVPGESCCCPGGGGGDCPDFPTFTIDGAFGAETGSIPPRGGGIGPSPFMDSDPDNDFFGTRLVDGDDPVLGELTTLWAGSGGGGGGDAINSDEFPTPVFQDPANMNLTTRDYKGGAGGGGGGTIHILALGEIRIVGDGQIRANGGGGGTGESTFFIDRVGGGGGGGSGGHILLESAVGLNLDTFTGQNAIVTRGGPGGLGLPVGTNAEGTPEFNQVQKHAGRRINDGGAGGPGVIQVHVPGSTPTEQQDSVTLPMGAGPTATLAEFTQPPGILLVPSFGSQSRAQSDWIALGGASPAAGATDDPVEFLFGGTDANGFVQSNPQDEVVALAPVLSVGLQSVDSASSKVTVLTDSLAPENDVYLRNTALLSGFRVDLDDGVGNTGTYTVTSAEFSTSPSRLDLTLSGATSLALFEAGDAFDLIPRFFRVITIDGDQELVDTLRSGQTILVEFQGARIAEDGEPFVGDGTEDVLVDWTPAIEDLNDDGSFAAPLAFFRFAVTHDIASGGSSGLSTDTPVTALDFLRVPFRFSGPEVP